MDYKKLSLSKMGDALVKAMEAKEHFDNKSKLDPYSKKVKLLKETLTEEYKLAIGLKASHSQYTLKAEVIEKHINYVKKIQNNKSFDTSDKQIIDRLLTKYGIDS
jgi:hypothetical protein